MISYGEGFPYWNPEDERRASISPSRWWRTRWRTSGRCRTRSSRARPFLSEGLAWYSAMQAREERHAARSSCGGSWPSCGNRIPYAPIRRGEPLLRALDPYLAYRRGPFAMYALSEYVGEDRVNGALRRLIEKHDAAEAPLATTLDLYRELQAVTPDSLKYLLHDLFEVNTFWELETRAGHGGADRETARGR